MATLADIMTREVTVVRPDLTLRETAELLSLRGITGAPVVGDGRVLGVITATDIMNFAALARSRAPLLSEPPAPAPDPAPPSDAAPTYFTDLWSDVGADVLERFHSERYGSDLLDLHRAEEAMSRLLFALPPDAELHDAARYMLEKDVHRVLVMERGKLVGVATTTDFMRAIADRRV